MKSPCHGCMSRHEACHSNCEKYLAYKAETDKRRAERLKDQMAKDARFDLLRTAQKRRKRRKNVE